MLSGALAGKTLVSVFLRVLLFPLLSVFQSPAMMLRSAVLIALLACAAAYTQVPHLHDSSFEHLTQAATGQTTGIWWACAGG